MFGISNLIPLVSPDCATIRQRIKLVEKFAAIPGWLGFILCVGPLPGIDLITPPLAALQTCARDRPCIRARSVKKLGVVPHPLAAASKLFNGQVPRQRHGY